MIRPLGYAALSVAVLGATAAGQASSSNNYFSTAVEDAPGKQANSTNYNLVANLGSGVVPERATSTNFTLEGGFPATLPVSIVGRPWVTGVLPCFTPFYGGSTHRVYGAELDLGPTTTVTVDGVQATVTKRNRAFVDVQVAPNNTPGWKTVAAANAGGTSELARGLGVLPLIDMPDPFLNGTMHRIRFVGTSGDTVYWVGAMGVGNRFVIPSYVHFLELEYQTILQLDVQVVMTAKSDGTAYLEIPSFSSLGIPGYPFGPPIYFQAFCFSNNPGYAPGGFSNYVVLP